MQWMVTPCDGRTDVATTDSLVGALYGLVGENQHRVNGLLRDVDSL